MNGVIGGGTVGLAYLAGGRRWFGDRHAGGLPAIMILPTKEQA
jgi:hypothetical protein